MTKRMLFQRQKTWEIPRFNLKESACTLPTSEIECVEFCLKKKSHHSETFGRHWETNRLKPPEKPFLNKKKGMPGMPDPSFSSPGVVMLRQLTDQMGF